MWRSSLDISVAFNIIHFESQELGVWLCHGFIPITQIVAYRRAVILGNHVSIKAWIGLEELQHLFQFYYSVI